MKLLHLTTSCFLKVSAFFVVTDCLNPSVQGSADPHGADILWFGVWAVNVLTMDEPRGDCRVSISLTQKDFSTPFPFHQKAAGSSLATSG